MRYCNNDFCFWNGCSSWCIQEKIWSGNYSKNPTILNKKSKNFWSFHHQTSGESTIKIGIPTNFNRNFHQCFFVHNTAQKTNNDVHIVALFTILPQIKNMISRFLL